MAYMDLSPNKYINIFLDNNQKIKSSLIQVLETDASLFFRKRNNENIDYFKNLVSSLEINHNSDYKINLSPNMFDEEDSVIYNISSFDSNVKLVLFFRYNRKDLISGEKKSNISLNINLNFQNYLNTFSLTNKARNNFSITNKDYTKCFLFSNNRLMNYNDDDNCSVLSFFRSIKDDSIINISDFVLNNKYTKEELKEKYELLSITYDFTKQLPEEYIINIEDYKNDKVKNKITNIQVAYDK